MIPSIEEAKAIVDAIQNWIDDRYDFGWTPVASFVYSGTVLQVSIGDYCVFCSEEDEFLSIDDCLDKWHDHIREQLPFLPDLEQVVETLKE